MSLSTKKVYYEHLLTQHSFGAVLEEFEVRDALMNALAGKTNGGMMIGA